MKTTVAETQKTVLAKKLPGLLKKSYTQKQFEKKILKKIYVAADKEFINNYFTADADKTGSVRIPKNSEIVKADFIRLKTIAKEIRQQKFGVKLIPLAALIGAIVAVCVVVGMFKNIIVKRAIVAGMQSAFQAKTDIGYLDFQIFGAKLTIKDLQQANKNDVMKNIFQVGEITFDFNLTELLRGKFDAENITVADVLIGTERKTSGYIPIKQKREEKQNESRIADMQKALLADVQKTLFDTFAEYNPQTIIKNVESNLKSPAMAESTKTAIEETVAKWKDTPQSMEKSIREFSSSVDTLVKTDWAGVKDPVKLKEALDAINAAVVQGKNIKTQTEKIAADFKSDTEKAERLSKEIGAAIASDKALIDKEIAKFKTLKNDGIGGIFNKVLTAFMYNLFGTYYPYVQKGIDTALQFKSKAAPKPAKKKAKKVSRRMKGTDIYYKNDTVPKFLIEKAYGSGANWSVSAKEISSDPDKRGKPAELSAAFAVKGIDNAISAVIDGRRKTDNPLLSAKYSGSGFPLSLKIDDAYSLAAHSSALSCTVLGDDDGSFRVQGAIDMSGMKIATPSFEPAPVYEIYRKAAERFTALKVGFTAGYVLESGITLSIDTDAAERFAEVFQSMLASELTSITASAREKVNELLAEKTGGVSAEIVKLTDIQNGIKLQEANFGDMNAALEKAQRDILKQLAGQTGSDAVQKAAGALKGLFGR